MPHKPYTSERAAKDPITGLAKKNRGQETIDEFAERHGWQIRRTHNASMGYYDTWRFVDGLKMIDVTLSAGRSDEQIVMCRFNGIDLPRDSSDDMRKRLERAIVGMDCTCQFRDWPEHHVIDPKCLVHGTQERIDV